MSLDIQRLKKYNKILVTGPQRSGTTIGAYILAKRLGYKFVPEESINISRPDLMFKLFQEKDNFVLQAPCMTAYCGQLRAVDGAAVVYMIRNHHEIQSSVVRIGWQHHKEELARYHLSEGDIVVVKNHNWTEFQRKELKDKAFEMRYEELKTHPEFVEKEHRKHFRPRQISPKVPSAKEMT